jgi:hypothetical protein
MQITQQEKQFIKGDKWFFLSYKLGDISHLIIRKVKIVEIRKDGYITVQTNDGLILADESRLVKVIDLVTSL